MAKPALPAQFLGRLLFFLLTSVALGQPALLIETLPSGNLRLRWAHSAVPVTLESAASLSAAEGFTPVAETPMDLGQDFALTLAPGAATRFYRLRENDPAPMRAAMVAETSPMSGEGGVAVTRETVLRLDAPLAADTLPVANALFAEAAGRRLLTRTELAADRRSLSLFYLEPLPAAARVNVTLNGGLLRDAAGFDLDADGDSVPGGILRLSFDTLNNVAVGETAVRGRVLASEKNPDGTDRPLVGVTITVNGMEESLRTVTAADGSFVLQPAPTGRFFVQVDGRTAQGSQWPGGAYYPFVGKAWSAVPGRTDNLAGGTGLIYLPRVQPEALQAVSPTVETRITFAPSVLAANPALAGVEIMVPPNSLFADNGVRGGMVGIAPVPPDRLPEPLPAGLVFPLVITIQTDGPSNFDRPVPVKFPNLPDPMTGEKLPPGAKTALWSFNHDTGRWEIQGPMTITPDGNFAVTDPGVGVRQPGWHGGNPGSGGGGPGGPGPGPDGRCQTGDCDDPPKDRPIGDCFQQSLKVAKGAVSFGQDLLELPENSKPFDLKKCGLNLLKGVGNATADCAAFDEFEGDDCAETFAEEGVGTLLGCLPYVGGVAKLGWDAYLLHDDYTEAAATCAAAGGNRGGAAPAGLPRPHDAVTSAFTAALGTGVTELTRQLTLSEAAGNYLAVALDGTRWSGIAAPDQAAAWFPFFGLATAAVAVDGDAGTAVSPAERAAVLAAPRPNGATAAEVDALLTHLAAAAGGTRLTDAAYRGRLAAAATQLTTALAARETEGWAFPLDGLKRALLASTQAQQVALEVFRAAASASVGGGGSGSGSGGGSGGAVAGGAGAGPVPAPRAERLWLIANLETGFTQRGRLNSAGRFDPLILTPQNFHMVLYAEPERGRIGAAYFMSASAGDSTTIPTAMMIEDDFPDADGDQLSDLAEGILGTAPGSADSDGDGVPDGAELANRSSPLDSAPLASGVVASVDTTGSALDVAVSENFAIVADGAAGFAVLDLSDPFAPVRMSQLDLAAAPKAVAAAGSRALLAAGSRFYVADFSVPAAPVVVADVALASANRVAVAGRTGFVTSGAKLRAVDLLDGRTLGEVTLPSAIGDLAVTRDLVLALTTTELRVFRLSQLLPGDPVELLPLGALAIVGSAAPLEDGRRLFAAGHRAYAGYFTGYSILDLADPAAPRLLAKQPTTQAAIHDFAADGSGRLVAVTSFGGTQSLAVSLYDVRDESDVTKFLASWNTPGEARALTLHRGLAFVADTAGGVQTVNFRAADTGTNAPTISLEPLLPAPGVAESGGNLRLVATTTDDVLVRDVEFYVDGTRVATDGNLPFEWHGTAPALTAVKANFTVRAKATDTGGNSRWSDELVIALRDTTPLSVIGLEPVPGPLSPTTPITRTRVRFDEPLDLATVTPATLTLAGAGPNQVRGDADDVPVAGTLQIEAGNIAVSLKLAAPLGTGRYRASLAGNVADLNQIPLGAPVTWDFEVLPPKPKAVSPVPGSVTEIGQLTEARAQFDLPMDATTLTAANVQVLRAGADGVPGNADDVAVAPAGVDYDAANRVVRWQSTVPLGADRYTVQLRRDLAGAAGNRLTNDFNWGFEVRGPVLWTRSTNGLWATATNWSTRKVPDRDFVVIDQPGELTVTGTSLNVALGWLRSAEALVLNGSTLRLGGDSFVRGALTLTSSTLVASNRFEVGGPLVLDNSALVGSSQLTLAGPLTLRRTSTLDGAADIAGPLLVEGAGIKRLRKPVQFAGQLNFREGPLALPAGTLTLAADAELVFAPVNAADGQRDVISSGFETTGTLRNFGAIRHQGGARALNFSSVNLVNHGLIEVTNGSLATERGRFDQGPAGRIRTTGPVFFNGTIGDWAGELSFLGGLTTRDAHITLRAPLGVGEAGLTFAYGNLTVRAPLTLRNPAISNGADLHLFDTLDLDGAPDLSAVIDGDGLLRTRGRVSFGLLQLGGAVRWENSGTLVVTNRRVDLRGNAVFHNTPAGTVDIRGRLAGLSAFNATSRTLNEGRILAAGTGDLAKDFEDLLLNGALENPGRIDIETGRLKLEGVTQHSGIVSVAAGAVLGLSYQSSVGGTHRFLPASTVTGAGTVEIGTSALSVVEVEGVWRPGLTRVAGGTLRLPGDRQLDRLEVRANELQPGGLLEVTERLDWRSGELTGPGVLRLTGQFSGPTNQFPNLLSGARFELASTVELDSLTFMYSEPGSLWRILPGAELKIHRNGVFGRGDVFASTGSFLNEGRLTMSPTATGLGFLAPLTNTGVITVQGGRLTCTRRLIQTAGQFRLEGGILRVDGGNGGSNGSDSGFGFDLLGGEFIGFGVVDAPSSTLRPFTNNAVLRPGLPIGRLTFEYVNYAQTTNGVLAIELGGLTPGTEFDQLQCGPGSRIKALAGTLEVKLVNGFVPVIGDRFLVVSGLLPSSDNRFATVDLPSLPADRRWQVNYLGNRGGTVPGVELQVLKAP